MNRQIRVDSEKPQLRGAYLLFNFGVPGYAEIKQKCT